MYSCGLKMCVCAYLEKGKRKKGEFKIYKILRKLIVLYLKTF